MSDSREAFEKFKETATCSWTSMENMVAWDAFRAAWQARAHDDRARDAEVAGLREALKEIVTLTVPRCGGPWTADINRIATNAIAAQATPQVVGSCGWSKDEWFESWSAGCGCEWVFPDGGPAENGMKFCPSCGKPVSLPAPPTKGASRD